MAETKLIPGFRFHPTDVELVLYYLKRKVLGQGFPFDVIAEIDIYKYAPWDLPDMSLLNNGDLEWYFFCPVGRKYSTGGRLNRATETGYWKTTGKDRSVEHRKQVVGMIRTLVFHTGKPPRGDRTDWVMHEFRLEDRDLADRGIQQDTYVICRVFRKEGPGPRNGAQYGKPFDEKDWDSEEEIDPVQYVPVADMAAPVPILPSASHISVASDMLVSAGLMPSSLTHPPAPSNQVDDDILSLLDMFTGDDNAWAEYQNHGIEVDNPGEANNAEGALDLDPNEIFVDLGQLDRLAGDLGDPDRLVELDEGHGGQRNEDIPNEMLPTGDLSDPEGDFLELNDLEVPLPPWFFW